MSRLKVGILTTWNTQCGIAEYSRYLTKAFRRRDDDIDLTVLGSKNYDERKVAEDESYVMASFGVLPWNRHNDHTLEVDTILEQEFDVLHIQYEVLLYNQERFNELVERFQGVLALTYHDNCIPPGFPYDKFDLLYTHREEVGVGEGFILPFGIERTKPVIKTFGLGRSRADIIGEICTRHDWIFESSFGEHTDQWKSSQELHLWLRDSDVIVLYYDDVPSAGSSQAARTAMATRRPLVVNDVTWFKDIQTDGKNVFKVKTPQELAITLGELLVNWQMDEYSWDRIVNTLIQDYKECQSLKFPSASVH